MIGKLGEQQKNLAREKAAMEDEVAARVKAGKEQLCKELMQKAKEEAIEVEGPIQKDWPPPSHKALFFAGDTRQDMGYAEEIFARLLPRAYRRPVTRQEIDDIVAVVKNGQATAKLSFPEAMRLGREMPAEQLTRKLVREAEDRLRAVALA